MADYISAADIEKFGYCPLSWFLSWKESAESDSHQLEGQMAHEKIARNVDRAKGLELNAVVSQKLVIIYAIIATIVATLGISLLPFGNKPNISHIMIVISLIWILAALFFLNISYRTPMKDNIVQYEKIILIFAIVATLAAAYSVLFTKIDENLALVLVTLSLLWLIAASYFLNRTLTFSFAAKKLKDELNIEGEIKYVDMGDSDLMISKEHGISGRPDYVLVVEGYHIPVEEKTGRSPRGPLFSHILQVAAYCLLLQESSGRRVPYGILKYGPNQQHIIEFDDSLRKILLEKVQEMRSIIDGKPAHRNHGRVKKCANCSRRQICPESLA